MDPAQFLLEHGANPIAQNKAGSTLLHEASTYKSLDIAQLLTEQGADVTARNKVKSTCYVPGHLAHIFLSFSTVMYLYGHMTSIHMIAYLYNRAASPGTPLFPPFVRLLLFPSYGSL